MKIKQEPFKLVKKKKFAEKLTPAPKQAEKQQVQESSEKDSEASPEIIELN